MKRQFTEEVTEMGLKYMKTRSAPHPTNDRFVSTVPRCRVAPTGSAQISEFRAVHPAGGPGGPAPCMAPVEGDAASPMRPRALDNVDRATQQKPCVSCLSDLATAPPGVRRESVLPLRPEAARRHSRRCCTDIGIMCEERGKQEVCVSKCAQLLRTKDRKDRPEINGNKS